MFFSIKNYSNWIAKSLIFAFLIILMPVYVDSANAKKPHHHHDKHREHLSNPQYENNYLIGLNQVQKTNLIDLLRGRDNDYYTLNPRIRIEITNQINSLPPGIQKRLAKGKPLPYGIAKKVILPQEVNSYLKLPQDYRIIVLGSSVIVLNSSDNLILDILQAVF
ncbi:MAG: hypothetical protein ACRCST_15055 [Turicibacter sp.]